MKNRPEFKRYTVLIGNFGSGKTELALNMALQAAEQGTAMLVDMDIINPYFKSSSKQELLEAAGVRVIKPEFANTTMDVPTLPAEIYVPFDTKPDHAVLILAEIRLVQLYWGCCGITLQPIVRKVNSCL